MKEDPKHRRKVMKWQEHECPKLKPGTLEITESDIFPVWTKHIWRKQENKEGNGGGVYNIIF